MSMIKRLKTNLKKTDFTYANIKLISFQQYQEKWFEVFDLMYQN